MSRIDKFVAVVMTLIIIIFGSGGLNAAIGENLIGQRFPDVTGQSLEEKEVNLPSSLSGKPAVLLIGYEQDAQFDIDRWLLGLIDGGVEARILELPTIPGFMASLFSGRIDSGMRSGIPQEDWSSVVTLYGDEAKPVAEMTGTDNGRLTRVVVLNGNGEIIWFDDTGYSARKIPELRKAVSSVQTD